MRCSVHVRVVARAVQLARSCPRKMQDLPAVSILYWTFAPLVALFLAMGWAHWRARPRPPVDAQDSISEYERFSAAIRGNARVTKVIDLRDPHDGHPREVPSR